MNLQEEFRRGRGRKRGKVGEELQQLLRGWVAYYRMTEVKRSFEQLGEWIRLQGASDSLAAVEATIDTAEGTRSARRVP